MEPAIDIALDERTGLSSTSLWVFPCMTPALAPFPAAHLFSIVQPLEHDSKAQVIACQVACTGLFKVIAKPRRQSAIGMPLIAPGTLLSRFSVQRNCFLRTRLANKTDLPPT